MNTEYQLKSKLAWPVCVRKECEIKTNGTGAMTTAKKDFFKGYNMKIVI